MRIKNLIMLFEASCKVKKLYRRSPQSVKRMMEENVYALQNIFPLSGKKRDRRYCGFSLCCDAKADLASLEVTVLAPSLTVS